MDMYTENYIALLACIVSKKEITGDSAIRMVLGDRSFGWKNGKDGNVKHQNSKAVEVHDTVEDKVYKFASGVEAAEFIGMHKRSVSIYTKTGNLYKKRYLFKRLDKTRKWTRKNSKPNVIVIDTVEKKEYVFANYYDASKFVGMNSNNVSAYMSKKIKYKKRYEFRKYN